MKTRLPLVLCEIASVPGEGATFTLRIPSAPQLFQAPLRTPLTVATRNGA